MSGDIFEIKIASQGTAGSRTYKVKGGENYKLDLGGRTKERRMNGDGTGHSVTTAKPWMLEDIQLETSNVVDGIEFLQDVQNETPDAIFTISMADGKTYKGTGSIEGDLKEDTYEGYCPVSFSGSGILERTAG